MENILTTMLRAKEMRCDDIPIFEENQLATSTFVALPQALDGWMDLSIPENIFTQLSIMATYSSLSSLETFLDKSVLALLIAGMLGNLLDISHIVVMDIPVCGSKRSLDCWWSSYLLLSFFNFPFY